MRWPTKAGLRFTVVRIIAAVLIVALTTAVLQLLRTQLTTPIVALLYMLPVVICTTFWGLGSGILASLCAFLLFNYFFIDPTFTITVHHTQDLLALAVFLGVAILISQLVGQAQANLAAAKAREQEAIQLYELSATLGGLRQEGAITRATVERVRATTLARSVELILEASPHNSALAVRAPADLPAPAAAPLIFELTTMRGRSGELRLWPSEAALGPVKQRLIQTMVSQAALALEHVRLSRAETQTQILKESDRLKSALLASVTHDLRTPLVSITGALSSLDEDRAVLDEAAQRTLVVNAREEAERLNRLVGNLLDMTRLEAGAMKLMRKPVDVADLVGTALQQLAERLGGRPVIVSVPENLVLVSADFVLMLQVLVNLLDNALKYSPVGSPIELDARGSVDTIEIDVADRGAGIPAHDLARVFDKFYRVQRPSNATGTGLGLSICKGIVDAHGGMLSAENRPGGGTLMRVILPREGDRGE